MDKLLTAAKRFLKFLSSVDFLAFIPPSLKRLFVFFSAILLIILPPSLVSGLFGFDWHAVSLAFAAFGSGGALLSLFSSRARVKRDLEVTLIDPENPGGPTASRVFETVSLFRTKAGLKTLPEIGVYPDPEANAFSIGSSRDQALLAVSTGLLETLDSRAVEGVLSHEISHIASGDMVTMTLLQGLKNTFVYFWARSASLAIKWVLRENDDEREVGFFAFTAISAVLETLFMPLAAPLIYRFSRTREFRADRGGAGYAGTNALIHALESFQEYPEKIDARSPALSTLKFTGRDRGPLASLFPSHPDPDQRLQALRALDS